MASHVVILHSSARRITIKTLPGTYLSEVLEQACTKLGLDASQYGLRNNQKSLDLSRTFRLSGLPSGAKLELVQLSRSPSVVSVALQLPESESIGTPNNRLTDKFPSTTTLWLVLRKFESGAAGGLGRTRNFTARGVPRTGEGVTGAGMLYHESPVIQVMGRELASFTDLQKTLGQLGFNSGTALLRLSFQASETPLEEAMEQIERYFTSIEGGDQAVEGSASSTVDGFSEQNSTPSQDVPKAETETETTTPLSVQENPIDEQVTTPENQTSDPPPAAETTIPGPDQRVISVFAPPSSTAPYASQQAFNEEDYEPTVDHARLHQARLAQSSRNKRLPTDAEIAAQEETQRQKIANVKEVEIKIRFPDQTQVISKFSDADTGSGLYTFVKGLMEKENEPFILNFTAARGPRTVPNDPEIKLITGLAMTGKVLVNFLWHEGASVEARGGPVLKETFQSKAQEIQIPKMRESEAEKDSGPGVGVGQEPTRQGGGGGEGKGKGKVPKWLKLPGKK